MKNLIKRAILILLAFGAIAYAFSIGMERQQKKDCLTWKSWAEQSNLFKPSEDMLATCQAVGIKIK
ncbi:MAG: hypothetical protein UR99_C0017G0009 [Candidatus Moranbacteria bacterium GW2011_GWD2_36_12]|nr:MAG: hypothetical protein UR99_C0017G0009 [Candidatus Moranbacteria bacterium GW2011_GWD2_36_12]